MSSNSVLNAVQHYQRSIEKSPADVARLLHCVGKLYKIPITVELLQKTGVGRTVNALRKHEGELGVAAEAVVNKWKQLVAAESDMRAENQNSESEHDVDDEEDNNSGRNDQTNSEEHKKNQSNEYTPINQHQSHSVHKIEKPISDTDYNSKENTKKHHKSSSTSHKNHERYSQNKRDHRDKSKEHHSSRESLHKRKEEEDRISNTKDKHEHRSKNEHSTKHSSSKDKDDHHSSSSGKYKHPEKHRDREEKDKSRSKTKSNSEHKSQSSSPSVVKSSSYEHCSNEASTSAAAAAAAASAKISSTSSGIKRRHEDHKERGNSPKRLKNNEMHHNDKLTKQNVDSTEGDVDDGIDSSMGANFEDVLGMLNMPKKKAKRSLNALKNTSPKPAKKPSDSDNSTSYLTTKTSCIRNTEKPSSSLTSQRNLEKKPELLTSKVKLPPLDPSIALELPIISNNYKPLPLNPTVMDCVFNSTTSSSSRAPPPRLLSDAEAISHGISSKTMRTKVYSGVKTGQLLQVPTLFDLCIRILQKNIDALEYTGGVPFDVLRTVLERATPQQLFTFEEYNPYLMEDSDVLWKLHVERNYRGHQRQEMETWREMFMRCQEDQERKLNMLAENIKQSQKAIALPVRKTQLAFVDSMVKPPRNVVRKQEQYGTKSKLVATPAARVAALCNVTPNAAKQGDARLRIAAAFSQDPVKISGGPTRPKKAPLMAKTLQFMRGRLKR